MGQVDGRGLAEARRPRGVTEFEQGGCHLGGQRPQGQVGQALFETGDLFAQKPRDPDRDARIREKEPLDLIHAELADRRVFDGLGIVVIHPLAHEHHLPEDRARFQDGHRQSLAVLGDPENTHPSGFEDEQRRDGLTLAEQQLPAAEQPGRGHEVHGLDLSCAQISEQINFIQTTERVSGACHERFGLSLPRGARSQVSGDGGPHIDPASIGHARLVRTRTATSPRITP